MKIAPLLQNRKRLAALAAATVLLHVLALDWAGRHMGLAADTEAAGPVITAELRPMAPTPPAAAPQPKQADKPKPRPRPAPHAVAAPAPAIDSAPAPDTQPLEPPYVKPAVTEEAAPSAEPVAAQPDAVTAPPSAKTPDPVRVELPPPAQLVLQVEATDPKSPNPTYGNGRISWELDGNRYRLSIEADIRVIFSINLLKQTSAGKLGPNGLEPELATDKRVNRSQVDTHFNRADGKVTFSASTAAVPLVAGAQDRASQFMQVAGMARANAAQLNDPNGFEMQIGSDRDAPVNKLYGQGFEEIETKLGKLRVFHVSRPPLAGSYSSRIDMWFAPDYNWYPVLIRHTEANGKTMTMSVTKVLIANTAPQS
jgi:hypothetical protein